MNDLVAYLMEKSDIKRLVFVVGKEFNPWLIRDICKNTRLKELDVFISDKEKRKELINVLKYAVEHNECILPKRLNVHNWKDLSTFQEPDRDFALAFDALDDVEILFELTRLSPKYLCGALHEGVVSTFDIWQAYRTVCDYMYLLTWGENRRTEALNWTKPPLHGIELSVVFPMYKVAGYLPECIASVTKWKADYVEYLFVDDGSPDNCAEIVQEAAMHDSRIKLIQKENGGCASARQYGLDRAQGRYIGFIDPDDFIDESMYRKLLARAMIGSYEISYCGYNELYEETGGTRKVADLIGAPYCYGTTDPAQIKELIPYLRVAIWRGIYSADLIRKNSIHFYTDLRRFDDLPFKFEIFAVAKSVVSVPEYLYYYRLARPGQDVSANDERLYVHFPIFQYLDAFVQKKGSKELMRMLQIVKLHTHKYALIKIKPEFAKEYLRQAKKDLLSNMPLNQILLIYCKAVSRQDKLFFWAIYLRSPWLICMLKKRIQSKAIVSEKKRKKVLKDLGKFQ